MATKELVERAAGMKANKLFWPLLGGFSVGAAGGAIGFACSFINSMILTRGRSISAFDIALGTLGSTAVVIGFILGAVLGAALAIVNSERLNGSVHRSSIQRLLISFTLLVVGLAMVIRIFRYHLWTDPVYFIQWFISGALICAGAFTPFGRTRLGVVIGLVATAILTVVIFAIALQGLKIG